jgi:hypothetical protein
LGKFVKIKKFADASLKSVCASGKSLTSSFPRTREAELSTISLVESLDSRVRGNDGGVWLKLMYDALAFVLHEWDAGSFLSSTPVAVKAGFQIASFASFLVWNDGMGDGGWARWHG